MRNTPGKSHKSKAVDAYRTQLANMSFDKIFDLTAGVDFYFFIISQLTDAIHASTRNITIANSGVSLRCARSIRTGTYVSLLAPVKTEYIYRLPPKKDCHVYYKNINTLQL